MIEKQETEHHQLFQEKVKRINKLSLELMESTNAITTLKEEIRLLKGKREQEQKDYERNLASATAQHVSVVKEKELHLSKTMSFHEEKTSEYETAATALNQQQEDLKKRFKKSNDSTLQHSTTTWFCKYTIMKV